MKDKSVKEVSCSACEHKRNIPGDCHVGCSNPPVNRREVEGGGDERYAIAQKLAIEQSAVVRCIWPGSGTYPFSFDENTIFGCANFKSR